MTRFPVRTGLLALGILSCWTAMAAAQAVDMAKLLPDSTEMAFSLNIKNILTSAIYQKHFKEDVEKRMKENPQLQKVMESLSFDPLKDIISATLTFSKFNVRGPGQPPDLDAFVVVKGAFNVDKMNAALGTLIAAANQGDRVSTSAYGNYTIYEAKDSSSNKSFYAAIVDKETILGSTIKEQLTEGIERALGKKTGNLNGKFSDLLSKARGDKTLWGAVLMPASLKDMARMSPNPDAGEAIAKLESQTIDVNVRDGVSFNFNMNMADAGAATQLKSLLDQLKETIGAFALSNEQIGADLADLISALQVGANGKVVSLKGEVKAELVDKLVKLAKERGR